MLIFTAVKLLPFAAFIALWFSKRLFSQSYLQRHDTVANR
jgi:hypothetical protein